MCRPKGLTTVSGVKLSAGRQYNRLYGELHFMKIVIALTIL